MAYLVNGTEGLLKAGDTTTIVRGIEHMFWNAQPEDDLAIRVKLVPGLNAATFFETFSGLMRDSGAARFWPGCLRCVPLVPPAPRPADDKGRSANPMHFMALLYHHRVLLGDLPEWLRVPFQSTMYRLAPFFGCRMTYPEYSATSMFAAAHGKVDVTNVSGDFVTAGQQVGEQREEL